MAASVMKVGLSRVRMRTGDQERLHDAITRDSIRALIKEGVIYAEQKKGVSRGRWRGVKVRRGGPGSRKGSKGARRGKKSAWVARVRAIRRRLKVLSDRGEISSEKEKVLYRRTKGGQVRNVRHLMDLAKEA